MKGIAGIIMMRSDGSARQGAGRYGRGIGTPFLRLLGFGNEPITNNRQRPECNRKKKETANVSVFERLGPLPPQNRRAETPPLEDLDESKTKGNAKKTVPPSKVVPRRSQPFKNAELIALKRKYAGYIAPSATAGPILEVLIYGPSLPSSSPSSLPSRAPGGLVIAPMAGWALIVFIFSDRRPRRRSQLPGQGQNRLAGGSSEELSSSSSSSLLPFRPEEVKSQEKLSSSLSSRFPRRGNGGHSPVGQGFVILGPYKGVMILFVPLRWGEDIVRRLRAPRASPLG
ncbi:hypothetical protein QYE76_056407 [Lolium multiflorum]|uniref:Uncharacterized protein n=1 Tax=Lolium multiflorum TaxID=4521 RepID=A0AAD8T1L2_LOLMU|nr:hypothetical protein QYE76_056407 [Lolium multiflorum]